MKRIFILIFVLLVASLQQANGQGSVYQMPLPATFPAPPTASTASAVFAQTKEDQVRLLVTREKARLEAEAYVRALLLRQYYVVRARGSLELQKRELVFKRWQDRALFDIENHLPYVEKIARAQIKYIWAEKQLQPLYEDIRTMAQKKQH